MEAASLAKPNRERPARFTAPSQAQLRSVIAEAQKAGRISDRFAPVDLLALVLVIAAMWPALTHELAADVRKHSTARRRKVITDAVSALIAL